MLANGFTAFLVWILSAFIRANWLNHNIIVYLDKAIQKAKGEDLFCSFEDAHAVLSL
jgi:hypothetical protein